MTDSQAIRAMRAEAVELAEEVLGGDGHTVLGPELAERIETATARVLAAADEPVTIAFVGQFTTGKSVLLGALLGNPTLLPATANATTGNITVLRPVVGADDVSKVRDPVSVRYFDRDTLAACKQAMLGELAAEARKFHLAEPGGDSWAEITDWCRRVAWTAEELWVPVRELIGLRDAAVAFPWLDRDVPLDLPWATVRDGLLPIVGRPAGHVPVWELPAPRPLLGVGTDLDAAFLAASAPLVDRVTVTVEVPARYWPLDRDRVDDDVALLDFPGRGASPSEMRDRFLLRHTLPQLNTIMVMIDPERPDATDPGRIRMDFAQLDHVPGGSGPARRRDAVLALISRFDRLEESAPDLAADRSPLSATDILDHPHLTGLKALWREAERATSQPDAGDVTAIVSVATAWALGDGNGPPPIRIPAHRDPAEWRATIAHAARAWGQIAGRVPGDVGIAGPLRDYATDGGLGRLRALVTRHAEQHGLAQKQSRIHPYLEELRLAAGEARERLDEWRARAAHAEIQDRNEFRKLLEKVRHEVAQSRNRCVVDVFAPSFTLPSGRTGPVAIQQTVTAAVFAWPEWEELFDLVEVGANHPDDAPATLLNSDFLPAFTEAVDLARRRGVEIADDMVDHWLTLRQAELADWLPRLRNALGDRLGSARDRQPTIMKVLRNAVQTGWLGDKAVPAPETPADAVDRIFPLRTGRALPWHPDRADSAETNQVYILRVRRELAASAVRAGQTAMSDRLRQRVALLRQELTDLHKKFPRGRQVEAFLDDVFEPAAIPARASDPAVPTPRRPDEDL